MALLDQISGPRDLRGLTDEQLAELATRRQAAEAEVSRLDGVVAEAESAIVAELATETEARAAAVDGIPADLLAEYEQLRTRPGGVAVARLTGTQCGGCHLTLSAVEVARLRKLPPDALAHCEECGRLLVR